MDPKLKEATLLKEKGNRYYRDRNYKQAVELYSKAIDKCPISNKDELSIFYQNRAAANEMLKNWKQSISDSSKSLEYNPTYAKAYVRRAKAYEATKKNMDCLEDITTASLLEQAQSKGLSENTRTYCEEIVDRISRDSTKKEMAQRKSKLQPSFFSKRFFHLFIDDPINKTTPKTDHPRGYIKAKIAYETDKFDEVIPACCEEINSDSYSKYKSEALLLRGSFHFFSFNFEQAISDWDIVINDQRGKQISKKK